MLQAMSGQRHYVHSAICLWSRPSNQYDVETETTRLVMDELCQAMIEEYLDSGMWQGKAGGFGYQDDLGWIRIEHGTASNVVGLPKALLEKMLAGFDRST